MFENISLADRQTDRQTDRFAFAKTETQFYKLRILILENMNLLRATFSYFFSTKGAGVDDQQLYGWTLLLYVEMKVRSTNITKRTRKMKNYYHQV